MDIVTWALLRHILQTLDRGTGRGRNVCKPDSGRLPVCGLAIGAAGGCRRHHPPYLLCETVNRPNRASVLSIIVVIDYAWGSYAGLSIRAQQRRIM